MSGEQFHQISSFQSYNYELLLITSPISLAKKQISFIMKVTKERLIRSWQHRTESDYSNQQATSLFSYMVYFSKIRDVYNLITKVEFKSQDCTTFTQTKRKKNL